MPVSAAYQRHAFEFVMHSVRWELKIPFCLKANREDVLEDVFESANACERDNSKFSNEVVGNQDANPT